MRRLNVYRKEENEDIGNHVKTVKATKQQLVMLQVVPTWRYATFNILGINSMLLVNNQKQIYNNIFFAETLYAIHKISWLFPDFLDNFKISRPISKFPDFFLTFSEIYFFLTFSWPVATLVNYDNIKQVWFSYL